MCSGLGCGTITHPDRDVMPRRCRQHERAATPYLEWAV
jgi:hypothetical protein